MSPRERGTGGRVVVFLVLLALVTGGVALERRTPGVTGVRAAETGVDGPVVPQADTVSTAWYCAAGTAGAGGTADETVYVANLSPRDLSAVVTVQPGGDDASRSHEIEVGPYERVGVRVGDVLEAASPGVMVEVMGGLAIVEHQLRGANDVAMGPCAQQPSRTWYFASGGTPRGALQSLELYNPFGDDAVIDVTFLTEGGVQEPQALQGFVVGRRSKVSVPVHDLVPRQERVATLVRVRSGRIVAEQLRVLDGTDGRSGLAMTAGVPVPRTRWTIPSGTAAAGTSGGLAIANFGLAPAEVEVSLLLSGDGVLAPETVDIPSRSVVVVDPSIRVPAGTAYVIVVQAQGDTPVVAEAFVTERVGTAEARGAAETTGVVAPARRWALAGSPPRASAAVLAVNRATKPVTVEVRAYTAGDPDSPRSAPAMAIPPGKVARFDLDEWGIDPDQVIVVSADGPIVVGREVFVGARSLSLGVPFGP